jgi:hypothetical protein
MLVRLPQRPLLTLLALLAVLGVQASAQARRDDAAARALAGAGSIDAARALVEKGAARWPDYLRWLRGYRHSVFERNELAANARQHKFSILERERKFALLRDAKALAAVEGRGRVDGEHLLGIPTWGRTQPTWVASIADKDAARLGEMIRETLERPQALHHTRRETYGYFHMPGGISQPITHFHSVWRPSDAPRIDRWDAFLARDYRCVGGPADGGYRLYRVKHDASATAQRWPIVAVASPGFGRPGTMSATTDPLVGRMFLSVARAALRRAPTQLMTDGELQIDHAESRIVVRLASSLSAAPGEAR